MRIDTAIARRYLFSHKGTHFINIISGVTIFGLSLGATALILVLSVFNGFEDLIADMINAFNPDLKVVPVQGKYFTHDDIDIDRIKQMDGVASISRTINETALLEYDGSNHVATMKGVDLEFNSVTTIDSNIIEGFFGLSDDHVQYAVLGSGLARNLSVDVLNVFNNLSIHMPDRKARGNAQKPFRTRVVRPAGIFSIQQEIDNEYVLVSLDLAQALLGRYDQLSALEVKVASSHSQNISSLEDQLQYLVGEDYLVLNRYEQDEEFMKLMNIEKWMAFAIASLMILLIAFNLIGCLWMIVLDKKKDISILKAMGGTAGFIRKVFMQLGLLFTSIGLSLGIVLAVILYFIQKKYGIVTIPEGFVVDTYPITMKVSDIFVVAVTVLLIGLLASIPAATRAARLSGSIREN